MPAVWMHWVELRTRALSTVYALHAGFFQLGHSLIAILYSNIWVTSRVLLCDFVQWTCRRQVSISFQSCIVLLRVYTSYRRKFTIYFYVDGHRRIYQVGLIPIMILLPDIVSVRNVQVSLGPS